MASTQIYLGVVKAEFDYVAQNEEELDIKEGEVLWVLENDDQDWWKVAPKLAASAPPSSVIGLVPAAYVVEATPVKEIIALYSYTSTAEDELTVEEDERLNLVEEPEKDSEWVLCAKPKWKGAGYVPANYVSDPEDAQAQEEEEAEPETPMSPTTASAGAYRDPSELAASAKAAGSGSPVKTWAVTEIDAKKKKKKGTLGVGNGMIFFASESDKNPVQQYPMSNLTNFTTEKSKHLYLTLSTLEEPLHFSISSKDTLSEILSKLEQDRAPPTTPTSPSVPLKVPTPPPILTTPRPPPPPAEPSPPPSPPPAPAPPPASAPRAVPPPPALSPSPVAKKEESLPKAVAIYDFEAQAADELSVSENDKLLVLPDQDDEDWLKVRKVATGQEGVVPRTYVDVEGDGAGGEADNGAAAAAAAAAAEAEEEERRAEEERREEEERKEREEAEREAARKRAADIAASAEAERKRTEEREKKKKEEERKRREKEREAEERRRREEEEREEEERAAAAEAKKKEKIKRAASPRVRFGDDEEPDVGPRPSSTGPEGGRKSMDDKPKPNASKTRVWKDRTGQFKVEAEFLGYNNERREKIRLHKLNGVIVEVPLAKMSSEDIEHLKKLERKEQKQNSKRDDDDVPLGKLVQQNGKDKKKEMDQIKSAQRSSNASKIDWFEFFLNAGCDVDDCTRYASAFERDRIDEALLVDLEAGTMRSLGLREGDIIRVSKHIKMKYGPPPTPSKESTKNEEQLARDLELARQMQAQEDAGGGGLFTNASGGLKSTRRGRPPTRSNTSTPAIDASLIASASNELAKSRNTPDPTRSASPLSKEPPTKRSSSTIPLAPPSGFDDDAWTVKPTAPAPKAEPEKNLIEMSNAAAAAAPTPPPAISAPQSTPSINVPATAPRAESTGPSTTDTYNNQLLAQLGITDRATSAPPPSVSSPPVATFAQPTPTIAQPTPTFVQTAPTFSPPISTFSSPQIVSIQVQPTGFAAPRGPLAPVPLNQSLLNPLVPTNSLNTNFVPTRASPMLSQPTGFQPSPSPILSQPTGFQPSPAPLLPQPTGFAAGGITSQPQGFTPAMPMMPQPTGFVPTNTFGSMTPTMPMSMVSQPTGFTPTLVQPAQQPLKQFLPMPPSQQQNQANNAKFQPANVFAQMKSGTFANDNNNAPQSAEKYDALRPQPTGFVQPGFGAPQQFQPQPTGFQPQMGAFGQNGMMPQQTGYPGFQRQF
ncbi:hypothetical protein BT69DRAFT_1256049 [Atractiella rhizophila]|nr:hypothetical protein BT69DRAFT_1256049 [Atractiella rhizophila]